MFYCTGAFKVPGKFLYRVRKGRSARIVPACSCRMYFLDDSRYLSGDKVTKNQFRTEEQVNSVSLAQTSSFDSAPKLNDYGTIAARPLRNNEIGEKLLINNGSENCFPEL